MLNTISIFCRPLRSTTIIGAVTVACSPPSQFAVRRSFFTTARCDAIPKPLNIPLPPNSCAPNAEVAKLFNTTKPDVMQDLTTDSTNPLPSTVDLKNTKKWKCTVYQFESCPFCRKARACLDYLGIPYTVRKFLYILHILKLYFFSLIFILTERIR